MNFLRTEKVIIKHDLFNITISGNNISHDFGK